jgi:tetratricopeptide (TPR) repeat protein
MKTSATKPSPKAIERDLHQAVQQHQRGRLSAAETLYRRILAAQPNHLDALHLLGVLKQQTNRSDEALQLIGAALQLKATAPILSNFGSVLNALKRPREALPFLDRALALAPSFADAHSNKSRSLLDLDLHQQALASAEAALRFSPGHIDALLNMSLALLALKRPGDALASIERVLHTAPNHAQALNNRGLALMELGRFSEAEASLTSALAANSHAVETMNNLANLCQQTGRIEQAIAIYDRALQIAPGHPNLNFNAALAALSLGDFTSGWARYEWRWKNPLFRSRRRDFTQPLWLGDTPLAGKTILLHAEQGLGDTLQFVRYAPRVAALGGRVVLEVPSPLKPLLSAIDGVSQVIDDTEEKPAFDLHCPLMSLPLAFKTGLATIPADVPYVAAPVGGLAKWRGRIDGASPRIGLAWSGGLHHKHDRNRSIAFEALAPVLSEPGITFVSLQRDVRDSDAGSLANHPGIIHPGDELGDFADTAAIVSMLDLVITVDTAVAHLAGAMAKPTFLLTPFWADFRWLVARTDSPWYPTMTLFRQPTIGDWTTPIKSAADALRHWRTSLVGGTAETRA